MCLRFSSSGPRPDGGGRGRLGGWSRAPALPDIADRVGLTPPPSICSSSSDTRGISWLAAANAAGCPAVAAANALFPSRGGPLDDVLDDMETLEAARVFMEQEKK